MPQVDVQNILSCCVTTKFTGKCLFSLPRLQRRIGNQVQILNGTAAVSAEATHKAKARHWETEKAMCWLVRRKSEDLLTCYALHGLSAWHGRICCGKNGRGSIGCRGFFVPNWGGYHGEDPCSQRLRSSFCHRPAGPSVPSAALECHAEAPVLCGPVAQLRRGA